MATVQDRVSLVRQAAIFWSLLLGGLWMLGGAGLPGLSVAPPGAGVSTFADRAARIASRNGGRPATADEVRHGLLFTIAEDILRERANRAADLCDEAYRRHVVGRISHLARFRRNNPGIALPASGPVTEDAVRDAVTFMFSRDYVSIGEFPDDVRDWLFSYAALGAIDSVRGGRRC
jgi:hypothetical protein